MPETDLNLTATEAPVPDVLAVETPRESPLTEPEVKVEGETPVPPKKAGAPKWVESRLGELSAQRNEEKRRADKLAAENRLLQAALEAKAKGQEAAPVDTTPRFTEEEVNRRAAERAHQIAQQQNFDRQAQKVIESGKGEFADFDSVLANYKNVLDPQGESPKNIAFLNDVFETEAPHKVLYALGQDLDEAQRIINLPPAKRAVELYKLNERLTKLADPPAQTKFPAPVKPVGGRTKANPDTIDDRDDAKEWMRKRSAEVQAKRASGQFRLH